MASVAHIIKTSSVLSLTTLNYHIVRVNAFQFLIIINIRATVIDNRNIYSYILDFFLNFHSLIIVDFNLKNSCLCYNPVDKT